jgi:hypothetical protein
MLIRYLNKEKFEWLICDEGIYIGAASTQSDTNDGVYDSKRISEILKAGSLTTSNIDHIDWQKLDGVSQSLMLNSRESNYLSSWFSGENETPEMWSKYGSNGVALISDEISIIRELPDPLGNAASFYKVIYNNSEKANAIHDQFKFKEEKFQHESEFRLIIDMRRYSTLTGFEKEKFGAVYSGDIPSYEDEGITCCMSPQGRSQSHSVIRSKDSGYVISTDLGRLIKEFRLYPNCTVENERQIRDSLKEMGHCIAVKRSSLESKLT